MAFTMNEMRKNRTLTDVVLQCGDLMLPGHKAVLSSKSSYFYLLFAGATSTSDIMKVVLEDVDAQTMEPVLEFIYTGNLNFEDLSLRGIVHNANVLGIQDLLQLCTDHVSQKPADFMDIIVFMLLKLNKFFCKYLLQAIAKHSKTIFEKKLHININLDDFKEILILSKKNYEDNDLLLEGIIHWVKHDTKERSSTIDSLLDLISFEELKKEYLLKLLEDESIKEMSPSLHDSLVKASQLRNKDFELSEEGNNKNLLICGKTFWQHVNINTGVWSPAFFYPSGFTLESTAVIHDHWIYSIGMKTLTSCNPFMCTINSLAPPTEERYEATSTVLNDCIYLIGGLTLLKMKNEGSDLDSFANANLGENNSYGNFGNQVANQFGGGNLDSNQFKRENAAVDQFGNSNATSNQYSGGNAASNQFAAGNQTANQFQDANTITNQCGRSNSAAQFHGVNVGPNQFPVSSAGPVSFQFHDGSSPLNQFPGVNSVSNQFQFNNNNTVAGQFSGSSNVTGQFPFGDNNSNPNQYQGGSSEIFHSGNPSPKIVFGANTSSTPFGRGTPAPNQCKPFGVGNTGSGIFPRTTSSIKTAFNFGTSDFASSAGFTTVPVTSAARLKTATNQTMYQAYATQATSSGSTESIPNSTKKQKTSKPSSQIEKYNIHKNFWEKLAPLKYARQNPGVAALENKLLVLGGYDSKHSDKYQHSLPCECYDISSNQWTEIITPAFISNQPSRNCFASESFVFVMQNDFDAMLIYDINKKCWWQESLKTSTISRKENDLTDKSFVLCAGPNSQTYFAMDSESNIYWFQRINGNHHMKCLLGKTHLSFERNYILLSLTSNP